MAIQRGAGPRTPRAGSAAGGRCLRACTERARCACCRPAGRAGTTTRGPAWGQLHRDDGLRRQRHSHCAAGERRPSRSHGVGVVHEPRLGSSGREAAERDLGRLGCRARVGEHDDDRPIGVLERPDRHAGDRARRREPAGAGADEARPHGERPQAAGRDGRRIVQGRHEVARGLRLVDLEALPVDVRGQVRAEDASGDLARPGHALAGAAAAVPRGAPRRVEVGALGLPHGQARAHDRVRVAGVHVRGHGPEVLLHAGGDQRAAHLELVRPAHAVAAGDLDAAEAVRLESLVQSRDERSGFLRTRYVDEHRGVSHAVIA